MRTSPLAVSLFLAHAVSIPFAAAFTPSTTVWKTASIAATNNANTASVAVAPRWLSNSSTKLLAGFLGMDKSKGEEDDDDDDEDDYDDDEEDEDEDDTQAVVATPITATEGDKVAPKREDEWTCTGCFLIVSARQFGKKETATCPSGESDCPSLDLL